MGCRRRLFGLRGVESCDQEYVVTLWTTLNEVGIIYRSRVPYLPAANQDRFLDF